MLHYRQGGRVGFGEFCRTHEWYVSAELAADIADLSIVVETMTRSMRAPARVAVNAASMV